MTRKIIFLDVDGTIIDYDNHIPESAVTAIRQAREIRMPELLLTMLIALLKSGPVILWNW